MAQFTIPIKTDLKQPLQRTKYVGKMFTEDNQAHRVEVSLYHGVERQEVVGEVQCFVLRSDGYTVPFLGFIENGLACTKLPQAAYAVVGPIAIVIREKLPDDTKTVIAICDAYVSSSSTDNYADAGTIVLDVNDLLERLDEKMELLTELGDDYIIQFDTAKTTTETARDSAIQSASDASAAKTAAETARDSAIQSASGASAAKTAAETARDNAAASASTASTAKTAAEAARDNAAASASSVSSAKTAAETARDNAAASASSASAAKTAAETARDNAAASASAASTAKTAAETARDAAAQSASGASAAKTAAETARDNADASASAASTAQSAAESAQAAAESAKGDAVSAKIAAETAQTAAESARDDAAQSASDTLLAKTAAETARDNAAASASSASSSEAGATAAKEAAEVILLNIQTDVNDAIQNALDSGMFIGPKGDDAAIVQTDVYYQNSTSGTDIPSGDWLNFQPVTPQGQFLWIKTGLTWNNGQYTELYAVSRQGIDGTGSVVSVNGISPDSNGNVQLPGMQITVEGMTAIFRLYGMQINVSGTTVLFQT